MVLVDVDWKIKRVWDGYVLWVVGCYCILGNGKKGWDVMMGKKEGFLDREERGGVGVCEGVVVECGGWGCFGDRS
jgi:hypothetical protein